MERKLATLWSKKVNGKQYRVTSAGNTVRLYSDGVFHSQYNPRTPFSGTLWDCLSLPALLFNPGSTAGHIAKPPRSPRILILGVGGGAVIKQLQQLFETPIITGIDLDPVHLQLAARWFKVDIRQVQLVRADAQVWLENYTGKDFDIILDDLFLEQHGEPLRAVALDKSWGSQLVRHLEPAGTLITNNISRQGMLSAWLSSCSKFANRFYIEHPGYENCIGVYTRGAGSASEFRKRLGSHPAIKAPARRKLLALRVKSLRSARSKAKPLK